MFPNPLPPPCPFPPPFPPPSGAVVTELTVVSLICRRCERSRSERFEIPERTLLSRGEGPAVVADVGEVVVEPEGSGALPRASESGR